jgi:hypothetical protein
MILVAALYDREQIISNAQERLAILNSKDIANDVANQAAAYTEQHKDKASTASSLRNLAQALKNNPSTSPLATQGSSTSDTGKSAAGSGGGISPLLVIVLAIVIAGLIYFGYTRILAKPHSSASRNFRSMPNAEARQNAWPAHWRPYDPDEEKRPSDILSEPKPFVSESKPYVPETKPHVSEPKPYIPDSTDEDTQPSVGQRAVGTTAPEETSPPRTYQTGNVSEPRPYVIENKTEMIAPSEPDPISPGVTGTSVAVPVASHGTYQTTINRSQPTVAPGKPPVNPKTAWSMEPKSGSMVFDCHFRYDDDPYDEVHSIVDPLTKMTVGACGISSAGKLSGRHGGTYSFLVWLHDYGSGDEVCCMGIISKWAESNRALELRDWSRKERIRKTVNVVDAGRLVLETSGLRANASVVAYDYIESSAVPRQGCFRTLNLRFHVMTLA